MSVFNFKGYLAPPRQSLGGELIGFNAKTGQPVQAAAGGVGSYLDLSQDYYKTFQHENWQHPGSSGWSSANMPGWGNNPNLQMFPRRGVGVAVEERKGGGKTFLILGAIAVGLAFAVKSGKFSPFGY